MSDAVLVWKAKPPNWYAEALMKARANGGGRVLADSEWRFSMFSRTIQAIFQSFSRSDQADRAIFQGQTELFFKVSRIAKANS